MTKTDKRALDFYVRWVADTMGLRDWTIRIDLVTNPGDGLNVDDDEECNAAIQPVNGRKFAVMRMPLDAKDRDPVELRHTVVHELVHCHLEPLWDRITHEAVGGILGAPANQIFIAGAEQALEYAVDGLADVIAPHMPVIDWTRTR